ncbi:MAG: ribokinase [Sedimentisphaerales bacterium]|nr:ribokinase [Sedimentisphaerales bacterium]MBN2844291.1 ribokinase [Sedimentisphaerales bacterium]
MLNMTPRIVTVGGGEIANIAHCPKIPSLSETVPARDNIMSVSGKGASQAATMATLGGDIHFIGCLGKDPNGDIVASALTSSGVKTDFLVRVSHPTATSLVMVDYEGDMIKAYYPGANLKLTEEMVRKAKGVIAEADMLVCQLEIHNSTLEYVIAMAAKFGVPVVLNSSPALPYDSNLYSDISLLVMNHIEAEYYTGREILTIADARKTVEMLLDDGARSVAITMGNSDCMLGNSGKSIHVSAPKVKNIDSTSADDIFTGALCWSMACGSELEYAAEFACRAASLSLTRAGAFESIPTLKSITTAFGAELPDILHL